MASRPSGVSATTATPRSASRWRRWIEHFALAQRRTRRGSRRAPGSPRAARARPPSRRRWSRPRSGLRLARGERVRLRDPVRGCRRGACRARRRRRPPSAARDSPPPRRPAGPRRRRPAPRCPGRAGRSRRASRPSRAPCRPCAPSCPGGADKDEVVVGARLRKGGVLGQEAPAGVHRLAAGRDAGGDHGRDVQVAAGGRGRADPHGAVGHANVQRVLVSGRVDGNRLGADLVQRADDAHRHLAAVRDENTVEGQCPSR